jgi:electron transfer flavoprotein beta subunit
MNIVACYKYVLDEADIRIDPESKRALTDRAKRKISEYDRNAIECAVSLAEALGGTAAVVTAGTAAAQPSLKDALSRGPESAAFVQDEAIGTTDSAGVSRVLAAAIKSLGQVDLVVCGEGSSDNYSRQVGPRVGQLLGIPVVTCVNKIGIEGDVARCERKLDDGVEVVEVSLPALVSVLPDLNVPRIPGLKQILAASKKPVQRFSIIDLALTVDDIAPKSQRVEMVGVTSSRRNVKLTGRAAEITAAILEVLKQEELV